MGRDTTTAGGRGLPRRTLRERAAALGDRLEPAGRDLETLMERPTRADWLLTVALASLPVTSFLLLSTDDRGLWDLPAWVGALLLVPQLLPLAWRRIHPHRVMGIVGYATGAYFLLGFGFPYIFNAVGVIVALYSEAAYGERRSSGIASLAITLGFVLSIAVVDTDTLDPSSLPYFAFSVFVFATAWATGDAFRSRRLLAAELRARAAEAERRRVVEADTAVLAERTRIARELHDLIAHTVSVMVVQAGAGRRVEEVDPGRAHESLAAIETTGRSALAELRRLVTVLRAGDDAAALLPQPGLDALGGLVATLADAGVPVRLAYEGTPSPVPPSVDLSAYRIVQEAVTNVLKHAGDVRDVAVTVRYLTDAVEVEVVDDGAGAAHAAAGSETGGSGLVGMRERAALFGGSVQAGPRLSGGYRVHAALPFLGSVPSHDVLEASPP